ncbi:dihydroxyacetone kinase transcriptional activator DhaS [Streptococcus sp. CSL10205-OR2]|uniref:dihydroxyacetone kinase transcriptional activator DhaS n=1 Tax=Streptococcus sp. CSL10205-OR2 TaxID=2980558 RepID=UPI0021DAD57F|nr:dihydroxyacetone kinase transcriptional activator DhaS [Streptococcus sp. CSL10205-OR2]MCU9533659.1 dihydroxyacetone kinase transcriptional activator DhaS [Streptococcus sp. CSL10205-OR2]
MTSSLITKKKIAKAFKKQMAFKPFEKISVVDIMMEANIRRQTFYNHFVDKYELLDWVFKTELQEQVTDNLNYISGFHLLEELIFYFERNQSFYKQLFDIKEQNDFYHSFEQYCFILMEKIISEHEKTNAHHIEEKEKCFLIQYHAKALANMIKSFTLEKDFFLVASQIKAVIQKSLVRIRR